MHFAPDTEYTLDFAVALINTDAGATKSGVDELSTVEQVVTLTTDWGYTGRVDGDAAELAEVRASREAFREMWTLDRIEQVPIVNAMLRDANAQPFLIKHEPFDWHLHATEPTAPLAERMRVEVCFALIDVIRSNENWRMRSCAADDCTGVFVDLSRNGSKRFCSVRCGNRMNMVAFRDRSRGPLVE